LLPTWVKEGANTCTSSDSTLGRTLKLIFESDPVQAQVALLARIGSKALDAPIVWKPLPGPCLRAIFPVDVRQIEDGTVTAVVTLHNLATGRTMYAHPMHAGPGVNPLLAHLDGPMSQPKAQTGVNGDRTTRRMMEHKKALWDRFLREVDSHGLDEASNRWKSGYYWALRRLYFCDSCPSCWWGSPFYAAPVPSGVPYDWPLPEIDIPKAELNAEMWQTVQAILDSPLWKTEAAYALRGDFTVNTEPALIERGHDGTLFAVFPMEPKWIQGGTLIALGVTFDPIAGKVIHAHCLSAGPETEILYRCGARALGLPMPKIGAEWQAAVAEYKAWREKAWTQFWLDDLLKGGAEASKAWLEGYWQAMGRLFG
jgi:hypothetical protein